MPLYFLALIPFFLPIYGFSQTGEIPFQGPKNIIEYKQAGNTYTWQPVTGETPRPAQPYRPDLSGGKVSDVEPQIKFEARLPYEHKGGDSARVNVRATVDPKKVAQRAKDVVKGAAAGAATSGNPYVTVAALACGVFCDALIDWGVDQLELNDGHVSILSNSSSDDYGVSNGFEYSYDGDTYYLSLDSACISSIPFLQGRYPNHILTFSHSYSSNSTCVLKRARKDQPNYYDSDIGFTIASRKSSCPSGHYYDSNSQCYSFIPQSSQPLDSYIDGKYTGEGWNHWWSKMTAEAVKNGANVFTDGTSLSITGPALVPLSTTQSTSPVNLVPGTNTPAPVGHTGPTDSGTKTETTTTQAKNTYSGNQQTVSTQTTTTTNITNNITNNTTTNITNQTETDLPPEKESEDICDKNPDSLACAELDTPEGEIPRDTIEITFQPDDLGLGSGTCPADRQIGPHTFSYAATCSTLSTYVYPLVIALSMFGALLIIFVGKTDA